MATRPPIGLPKLSRRSKILITVAVAVILLLVVGSSLLGTYVDYLWFGEVGFRSVFSTVLVTRIVLFFAVGLLVGGALALSLFLAYRSRPVFVPVSGADDPLARYRSTIVQWVRLFGIGVPALVGLIAGSTAQSQWQVVQLMLNSESFGSADPEFGKDIGFYAFQLPFITWLIALLFLTIALSFIGALVTHYIFGGIRLAGRGGQLTAAARIQLSVTAGLFVVMYAVDYFFERYELLFSDRNDTFTGATYTDLNAVLPAKLILMFIAAFCAVAFFAGAFLRNLQLPAIATALLILSSVLVGAAWPAVLEQFSVKPDANQKEAKSIDRNLAATREAFGITDKTVTFTDYAGKTTATPAQIRDDQNTIPNVRLLDPSILSATFTQREARENVYGFQAKLDVDRYEVNGKVQDYIVAAREINTNGLAENQRNWINQHMTYTHGNGFVAAPANRIDRAIQENDTSSSQGGYPVFTVSDLNTVKNNVKMDIPVEEPRIYFGELATTYAIVAGKDGDKPMEYDGANNDRFLYTGRGGVPVDSLFNRLVFAAFYTERNILFSGQITDGSKIMYNRDPRDRVRKAAPWLTVDGDPYPAVVDGKIVWIVDGYTTLEHYPYAQRTALGEVTGDTLTGVARQENRDISYIRNSVKATVDAYDGSVTMYAIDEQDPVLKAWRGVFPDTVRPAAEVPSELREHFRYPEDLFKVQRDLLARYHVATAQDFFSTNTFWNVPDDPTVDGDAGGTGKQPPYYVLAQAPGQEKPTFQVTSALTALRRDFLAAWVSVSSDPADYGKIQVLRLPTNDQTFGPGQVQNSFQTTPEFTQLRTLLQNSSVSVKFGNLLTLPVADGLLYVEPIYIQQRSTNSFPQLARVLVYFGEKVGFAPTLDAALDQVFGKGAGASAPKPVDGSTPSTSPSTPPSSTSATTPPPGAGSSATLDQAVAELSAALTKLRAAQQSGNFEEQGRALAELDAAAKKYEAAKASGGSTPGSTPQQPTPTPTGGG